LKLNEQQLRVVARVAQLMASRSSCDIVIQLRDGGVRDYDESTKLKPADMQSPDAALARILQELARACTPAQVGG